jgi:glycosyltransferase involved in cell wall biosynthesis
MLNIIIVADFPLEKTGIMSTVRGLFPHGNQDSYVLYSNQSISLNGQTSQPLENRSFTGDTVVFTHMECKNLQRLISAAPHAEFHVGDWPGNYWHSLIKAGGRAKGVLGLLRFYIRLIGISKKLPLIFVSREDQAKAIEHGFKNARYVPLGINAPTVTRRPRVNIDEICFSGNFRYEPNRLAAISLIERFKNIDDFKLVFVGYYANDLLEFDRTIEIHDNVPSVVDFLAERRPIYVSLIAIGAGAKNKILEAAIAGCPIICTAESLDASVNGLSAITVVESDTDVVAVCRKVRNEEEQWQARTESTADLLLKTRSWQAMAALMFQRSEVPINGANMANDHV